MITIDRLIEQQLDNFITADTSLILPFELRQKSRQRVSLENGDDALLELPRGSILRGGDLLQADNKLIIVVQSAQESVSTVLSNDSLLLKRACYHLGNRHVPLQITETYIRYQHDHVLDDMVRGLGLDVKSEQASFEPEPGAYSNSHIKQNAHAHSH